MLRLPTDIQAAIRQHGIEHYPYEGCGLLLGRADGDMNEVQAIVPVPNQWPDEEEKRVRFRIDPDDMLQAELTAMEKGMDIVGVFHSHPDHPPVASPRDLAWAAWQGFSYLITEIRNQEPGASRSWQLHPDRSGFWEEEIRLI